MVALPLGLGPRQRGVDEVPLGPVKGDVGLGRPAGQQVERRPAQQVIVVAAGPVPLVGRRRQAALLAHVVTATVDPSSEPIPFGQQGLVGDLDGRSPGDRVAIEAEQPMAAERVDRDVDRGPAEPAQLSAEDAAPQILRLVAHRHQPQQDLAGRLLLALVETGEKALGPAHQSGGQPAELPVGGGGDDPALPPVEELGQGVLQQRQGGRAVGDVGHDAGDQRRLELDPHACRRPGHRPLHLVARHGGDHLRAEPQQLAEAAMTQRPVVEVGAQRDQHSDPGARVVDRVGQGGQERRRPHGGNG
jgi:hypothetical protein